MSNASGPSVQFELETLSAAIKRGREANQEALRLARSLEERYPERDDVLLLTAGVLQSVGDLDAACRYYRKILARNPEHLMTRYSLGVLFHKAGMFHLAAEHFLNLVGRGESFIRERSDAYVDCFYKLRLEMPYLGRLAELIPLLDQASREHPELNFAEKSPDFEKHQAEAIARGMPTVFLNTMAKSGSVYIQKRTHAAYKLPFTRVSTGQGMLDDHVVPNWAESAARGGCLVQQHINASPENIRALAQAGIKKILVHIRDPRQAVISLLHHFTLGYDEQAMHWQKRDMPDYTPEFDVWDFPRRLEWIFEHAYPRYVKWVEDWLQQEETADSGLETLLVTYEDFHDDENAYFDRLAAFFGLDRALLERKSTEPPRDKSSHYRKGTTDEWRSLLSEEQTARANALLNERVLARFKWTH